LEFDGGIVAIWEGGTEGGREGRRERRHDAPLPMSPHGEMEAGGIAPIHVVKGGTEGEEEAEDGQVAAVGSDQEGSTFQGALEGGREGGRVRSSVELLKEGGLLMGGGGGELRRTYPSYRGTHAYNLSMHHLLIYPSISFSLYIYIYPSIILKKRCKRATEVVGYDESLHLYIYPSIMLKKRCKRATEVVGYDEPLHLYIYLSIILKKRCKRTTTNLCMEEGSLLFHQRLDSVHMTRPALHVNTAFAEYLLHFL